MRPTSTSNACTGSASYRTKASAHEPDQNGWSTWESASATDAAFPVIDAVIRAMTAHAYPAEDAFAVRLALDEALCNAIKHGNANDPGKLIRVRYRVTERQVVMEVADEGSGFDPHQQRDPLVPENLERPGGRGLFLMRAYMSWVRYNRTGNCVTLCRARSALPCKRLLVIEDDDITREAVSGALAAEGYAVQAAPDGQEALRQLHTDAPPDLILLDLTMPGMDGWQFRTAQRQDPILAAIPVLVVSAAGNVREKAAGLEAADYLQKPLEVELLVKTVRRHAG